MKLVNRPHNFPIFMRIFLLILASVTAVQLFNVALLVLVASPTPSIFSIAQISAAIDRGSDASGALRITDGNAPETPQSDPILAQSTAELAAALGIPRERVVLQIGKGRPFPIFGGPSARQGNGSLRTAIRPPMPPGLLVGNFVASVQLAEGHWRSVRPARSEVEVWRWRLFRWLIIAMLVTAPIAWLLARRTAKPISIFVRAAERLGRDPRAPALPIEGPPEIAEAAAAFNEMQARLTRYVDDRAMLTAAIAHDLRTPLMRALLRIDKAPKQLRQGLEADIREMEVMISSVIDFLREISAPTRRQRLDLRALVESVTDEYLDWLQPVALLDGPSPVIEADVAALKTLVENLMSNAIKYGGDATIRIDEGEGQVVVEVRDTGPGIAPDDMERAFQPFVRLEESRNRDTGGVGLGLTSARTVARAHGGDIVLINHPEGGLVARVTLPL
jgi:signal transduction histidine kinase